jgi:hypothetical protein
VYLVTSLPSGLQLFGSPNWTTELSLVQSIHSGCLDLPRIKAVPVVICAVKNCLTLKVKAKLKLVSSLRVSGAVPLLRVSGAVPLLRMSGAVPLLRMSGAVPLFPNMHRRYVV